MASLILVQMCRSVDCYRLQVQIPVCLTRSEREELIYSDVFIHHPASTLLIYSVIVAYLLVCKPALPISGLENEFVLLPVPIKVSIDTFVLEELPEPVAPLCIGESLDAL